MNRRIWKDKLDTFKKFPDFLKNAYYFQIATTGHQEMGYTIRVLSRAKIYLAIQESSELPETSNKDRSRVVEFTSLLSKHGWIKMESMLTTSCCKIKNIWEMNQIKKGINTLNLPQIKTNEFRLLVFVAGEYLFNVYLTQRL